MKKLLTLCLALLLVLGLSAGAWAYDELVIDGITVKANRGNVTDAGIIPSSGYITLSGQLDTPTEAGALQSLQVVGSSDPTINLNTNTGVFSVRIDIPTYFASGSKQVLIEARYGNTMVPVFNYTFKPAVAPEISATDLVISCVPHNGTFAPTGSNTAFTAVVPSNHNSDCVFSVQLRSGAAKELIDNSTLPSNINNTFGTTITEDIIIGNAAGETKTYKLTLQQNLDSNKTIGRITLTNASLSGTTFTINSSQASVTDFTFEIDCASTTSEITSVKLNTTNMGIRLNGANHKVTGSITIPANSTATYTLYITVKAQDGTTQTHEYKVVRQQATTISTYLTGLSAKSGNTTLTVSPTLSNNTTSYTVTVPTGTTSVTVNWGLATSAQANVSNLSGVTTTSTTHGNYATNNTSITLNMNASTNNASFRINVQPGSSGTARTYTINLQRANNLTSLSARANNNSGSTLSISPTLTSTSTANTYTVTVPTGTNSVYLSWVKDSTAQVQLSNLSGGISISSSNKNTLTTYNAGNNNATISFPSSIGEGSSASFNINVRYNNGTPRTYTIKLEREGGSSTASQLTSLYIKERETSSTSSNYVLDMNRSFSSSQLKYTLSVPYSQEYIWIYPVTRTSGATINVTGGRSRDDQWSNDKNNGFIKVRLDSGTNTIKLAVRSGSSNTTYEIAVTRASDVARNASLSSLQVSRSSSSTSSGNRYSLSPSFQYDITSYTTAVPTDRSEAFIHLEPYSSGATISVSNATKVSDNVYRVTLSGNSTRTVSIEVRNGSNKTTYEVKVNRGSANALLSNLIVSSEENTSSSYTYTLQPRFSSSTNNYLVIIPYSNSKSLSDFYVQATLDNSSDSLKVDGRSTNSGAWRNFNIRYGDTYNMDIEVKDDDTNKYKLTVYAVPKDADNVATLRDLDIRTGSGSSSSIDFNTDFSSSTTSYTATVKNDVDSLRVDPTPTDRNALVLVNDEYVSDSYVTVDLAEGTNTITVQVIAEDGRTTRNYTVRVTRSNSGNTNSALSGLEVRTASSQLVLSMVPGFNTNTTNYTVNVPDDVTAINFRPTTSDSGATIRIQGSTERSGSWTGDYAVSSGNSNIFTITVTASNGSSTTYTINVARGLAISVSNQSLRVNGTSVTSAAYNINSNNYFKLRDIAYALQGTSKNINVTYNEYTRVVSIVTGQNYVPIGGEMVTPSSYRNARLSNQTVTLDGRYVSISAYNIDGNNYFMLRDVGELLDCGVDYDNGSRTIMIDTSKTYTYTAD